MKFLKDEYIKKVEQKLQHLKEYKIIHLSREQMKSIKEFSEIGEETFFILHTPENEDLIELDHSKVLFHPLKEITQHFE